MKGISLIGKQHLKLIAIFLLGFTSWIPFLIEAHNLSPYKIVIKGEMWGWEAKSWTIENIGCYTGISTLVLLYATYILVVLAIFSWYRLLTKKKEVKA